MANPIHKNQALRKYAFNGINRYVCASISHFVRSFWNKIVYHILIRIITE